jgi:chemotaxis protein MotB
MPRRPRHAAHENHERWLVSYADFITLLFAFFVVMFATSQADKQKQQVVAAAVKEAFENRNVAAQVAGFLGQSSDNQKVHLPEAKPFAGAAEPAETPAQKPTRDQAAQAAMQELVPSMSFLASSFQQEIEDGKLDVQMEPRGLVVSLREAAFFPAASDRLNDSAWPILEKIAESINQLPNPVRFEGHTDARPIRSKRFRSNWELSTARGIAMMQILTEDFAVDRRRCAVSGFADTVPIADNGTGEGRAKNRRVDIIILNQFGIKGEPVAQAAPVAQAMPAAAPQAGSK